MYWLHEKEKRSTASECLQVVGSILKLWVSITELLILLAKTAYRMWDFTDMIHLRRRCRSLTELIVALKGENYSEKREKAIKLRSAVLKPNFSFSCYK